MARQHAFRPSFRAKSVVILAGFAALFLMSSPAFGSSVHSIFVSSPDSSTILRGGSLSELAPFIVSPGDAPTGLALGENGVLYAGFAGSNEVRAYDPAGSMLWSVSTGDYTPYGLDFDSNGDLLVVQQGSSSNLLGRYALDGRRLGGVTPLSGSSPMTIAVDGAGRIFTNDSTDGLYTRFDTGDRFGFHGEQVTALAAGSSGPLLVALAGITNALVTVDHSGSPSFRFLTDLGSFQPQGLAIDHDGTMLVSGFDEQTGATSVRLYSPRGALLDSSSEDILNPTFIAAGLWLLPEPTTLGMGLLGVVAGLVRLVGARKQGC